MHYNYHLVYTLPKLVYCKYTTYNYFMFSERSERSDRKINNVAITLSLIYNVPLNSLNYTQPQTSSFCPQCSEG